MKIAVITALVVAGVALSGCSAPAQPATPQSTGGASCTYLADGAAAKPAKLPASTGVPNTGSVDYVLNLNGQPVGLTLDQAAAPCTVNSFISLAGQGYFDKTVCHRLGDVPGSFQMLQCGDPTATGTGSPGYRFAEEVTGKETYPAGTLAMARTSQPSSQGSQFFLVFGDTVLPPNYTVFGTIDAAGLKVLGALAAAGTDNSEGMGVGTPLTPAEITSVKPR
ncbi:MAG: peptidylprolyl isomerase [Actinobacteria bacterium HGW-Actinobacteria-2]|nr:MAG: peptidylprolyl isomerase [Actinobacteria bacterium HGW-Actinobacteria-2]